VNQPAPDSRLTGLRRLISESAVYGLGGIANQALAIVLVPIYARHLGVANYGVLAVLNTTLSLTTMVVGLAIPQGFFRSYLKESLTDEDRSRVLASTLPVRLVTSFIGLVAFSALAPVLSLLLFGGYAQLPVILLIGPITFFDTLNLIPLSFLRGERRPIPYSVLAFTRAVLGSILIIGFVVVLHMGVLGVLLGSAISAVVAASIGVLILARSDRLAVRWDSRYAAYLLRFCLPLVPAAVAGWTLNLSDRYIIGAAQGFTAVGIYSIGYTIGLIMNALVIQPFSLAWGAAYWEYARQENAERLIARAMTLFVLVATVLALALSVFGTDVMRLLLSPEFLAGRFVIPFSAFAYVAYGMYTIAGTGLNLRSQTRWVPLTVGAAAAANLIINLLAVPTFGYMAAAWSTLISYGLLAVLTGWVSQRYYPVPWDYPRVVGAFALATSLAAAALLGPDMLAWRTVCFLALPVLLLLTGIFPRAEAARLRAWLSGLRRSASGTARPS
jgi:O-antigen/teichoic acid export membrane protein